MTDDQKNIMSLMHLSEDQKMFDMQNAIQQEIANQNQAQQIFAAVNSALTENIQLKKQMALNEIKNQKSSTINNARTKPFQANQARTGKRKGGSVKNKRKK